MVGVEAGGVGAREECDVDLLFMLVIFGSSTFLFVLFFLSFWS